MRPKRREDLLLWELEATDESMLVDQNRETATVLNALAAAVWLLCDGQRDLDQICEQIVVDLEAKAVSREQLSADVAAVLRDFERENLIWPLANAGPRSAG